MTEPKSALAIWSALDPMVEKRAKLQSKNCLRTKKMTISSINTTAHTVNVYEGYDDTTITIPYRSQQGIEGLGEGAGVIVEWSSDDFSTAIAVRPGAGVTNAYWDIVTPEMFGAVGDGTADDTAALRSCMSGGGKTIVMRRGAVYRITSWLFLEANTCIDMNGAEIHTYYGAIFRNYISTDTFTVYNGRGNITVRNGTLTGGGFSLIHADNVLLENLIVQNGITTHLMQICACRNVLVRGCSFVGHRYIDPDTGTTEYINIDPCDYTAFGGFPEDSPTYDLTPNLNLTFDSNYFSIGTGDFAYGDDAIGVHYAGPSTYPNHKNIRIVNNYIAGFTYAGLRLNCMDNVFVQGNTIITDVDTWAVQVGARARLVSNVTICGNEFRNTLTSDPSYFFIDIGTGGVWDFSLFGNTYVRGNDGYRGIIQLYTNDDTRMQIRKLDEVYISTARAALTLRLPTYTLDTLYLFIGRASAGTAQKIRVSSYYPTGFSVGEVYHFLYDNGGTPASGTLTITSDYTLTCSVTVTWVTGAKTNCAA